MTAPLLFALVCAALATGPGDPASGPPGPPGPGSVAPPPAAGVHGASSAVGPPPSPGGPSLGGSAPAPFTPTSAPAAAPSAFAPPAASAAPAPGDQRVTVYLRGVPSGLQVQAQRGEEAPSTMVDPGTGVLTADLYGAPSRFLQLRLLLTPPGGRPTAAYDGLVLLADHAHESIAFQFQAGEALRLPVSPSARTEVALDQRATWWVSFGWGALALAWMGVLGGMWALRSR